MPEMDLNLDDTKKLATETDDKKARWIYVGRRILQGGKLGYAWHDHEEDIRIYKKGPKPATVGGVFEVTLTPNGELYTGGVKAPTYVGMADELDMETRAFMLSWEISDREAHVFNTAQSKANAEKYDLLVGTLAPVTILYRDLPRHRRAALLASIIEIVTRGEIG